MNKEQASCSELKEVDWSSLAKDILEMICKGLTIPDQAQFGFVCRNWRSSTYDKARIWVPDTPWIVFRERNALNFRLLSRTHGREFQMFKGALYNAPIVGSCKGWLMVELDIDIFIVNLFSKAGYQLPSRATNQNLLKLPPLVFTISTCAHLNPVTVVGITGNRRLVWCTSGDEVWKDGGGDGDNDDDDDGGGGGDNDDDHDGGDGVRYGNVAFHNEKIYAIRKDGNTIDVFRVDNELPHLIPHGIIRRAPIPIERPSHLFDLYLVESKANLLVVIRYCDENSVPTTPISGGDTIDFEIFKVQEGSDVLVNAGSLEDEALFLSDLSCESVPAKHCPGHHENHIYFIGEHKDENQYEWGQFNVDDRSLVKNVFVPLHPHENNSPPIWLLPRYIFNCDCGI